MRNDKYWKYGCFVVVAAMLAGCIFLARKDLMLRKYCKDVELDSFFGQWALPVLIVLVGSYAVFVLWQWIAACPAAHRQLVCVTVAAVCLFGVLSGGYLRYHNIAYQMSEKQENYDKAWDKGLLYDLKGLFR